MAEPGARRTENELLFRRVNEEIERLAEGPFGQPGPAPQAWDFVCECSRIGCDERVSLTLAEYEAVRSDGRRFVLAPAHAEPGLERVVDRRAGYWVVEKVGEAGDLAAADDPRAR